MVTKKKIYHVFVENVVTHASENWTLTKSLENILLALEMDFWSRSCSLSRCQGVPNTLIRDKVGINIECKRLK